MMINSKYVFFNNNDIRECFEAFEVAKYNTWMKYIENRLADMDTEEFEFFSKRLGQTEYNILFYKRIDKNYIKSSYEMKTNMDRTNQKTGERESDGYNPDTGNGWMTTLMLMLQNINEIITLCDFNRTILKGTSMQLDFNPNSSHNALKEKKVSTDPDFMVIKNGKESKEVLELQTRIVNTKSNADIRLKMSKYNKCRELQKQGYTVFLVEKCIVKDTLKVYYEIINMNEFLSNLYHFGEMLEFISKNDSRAVGHCDKGEISQGYNSVIIKEDQLYGIRKVLYA